MTTTKTMTTTSKIVEQTLKQLLILMLSECSSMLNCSLLFIIQCHKRVWVLSHMMRWGVQDNVCLWVHKGEWVPLFWLEKITVYFWILMSFVLGLCWGTPVCISATKQKNCSNCFCCLYFLLELLLLFLMGIWNSI